MRAAAVAAFVCHAALATAQSPSALAYRNVADRFARGGVDAAAVELRDWPESQIRAAVTSMLVAHPPGQLVEAAAMLETDAAFRTSTAPNRRFHLDVAQSLVRYLLEERLKPAPASGIDGVQAAEFSKRWFLAVGLSFLTGAQLEEAERYIDEGLREFRADEDLSLAAGMIEEAYALKGAAAVVRARTQRERRRDKVLVSPTLEEQRARTVQLLAAERAYREVLTDGTGRPSGRQNSHIVLDEAHLRLGHVLMIRGEIEGARAEFTTLLAESPTSRVIYLSRLFLGRMFVDKGQLADAAREYEAAHLAEPASPTATIARAELADRTGQRKAAHDAVESLTIVPGDAIDPWWNYPFDGGGLLKPTADWLQAAIKP